MTDHSAEFRRCLERLDINGMRKLWRHVSPHLPQPGSDAEILITLHHARTQAESMPLKLRAYSHHWLRERSYPTGLPDQLKQSAERMYPRIAEAVGISVNAKSSFMKPIASIVQRAMADAVEDAYADGKTEPGFVKTRMFEARDRTLSKLIGVPR